MSLGRFIGRRIAEFVDFFRGRQAIPCTVDWDVQPGVYLAPPGAFAIPEAPTLAEIRGLQRAQGIVDLTFNFEDEKPREEGNRVDITDYYVPGSMKFEGDSVTAQFNIPRGIIPEDENMAVSIYTPDPLDDCCPDYDADCCLTTDTIGEIEGKK